MNFIFAQIFALLSSICLLASFWQKKRKGILTLQILDSSFDIIQYFLLSAHTGAIISCIGATRAYAFKKTNKKYVLYFYLILYFISSILTWNGLISIIPLLAALLYTIVVWDKKEKNIRFYSILVFLLWFTYDILVKAYVNGITDIILVISNILAIKKLDK